MKILSVTIIIATLLSCSKVEKAKSPAQQDWFFWSVDWHPTRDQFVVGGSNDSFLKLYSTKGLRELQSIPYQGTITQAKWHPTSNKLAVAVQDGKSKLAIVDFDQEQKAELDSITSDGARAIGWNRTGNLLAVGDNEGFLTIFDESGAFVKKVDTGQKGIIDLDWHPERNLIVAVGEKITLYDCGVDSLRHIEDREQDVLMLSAAWHPSGRFFVTGDYGDFTYEYPPLLQYWTLEGEKLQSIKESKAEIRSLRWSGDGQLLASTSEKIRLWNENGELVNEATAENLLWAVDWNNDDSLVIATDTEGQIIIWNKHLEIVDVLKR